MGFEVIGEIPDYARVNRESLNGHYMWQKVKKLKNMLNLQK